MGLRDGLQGLLRLHRESRETARLRAQVLEQGGLDPELPLVPGEPGRVRERLGRLAQGAVEAGRHRDSKTILLERFGARAVREPPLPRIAPTTYRSTRPTPAAATHRADRTARVRSRGRP